jgi:hypothetical protein
MDTGGDGPKMVELEQMRERYLLQDRVELLGSIRSSDVPSVNICVAFGSGISDWRLTFRDPPVSSSIAVKSTSPPP